MTNRRFLPAKFAAWLQPKLIIRAGPKVDSASSLAISRDAVALRNGCQ